MMVSVDLLTYNAERFIRQCLNSVLAQTYSKIEFLIIDNASQDNTAAIAQDIISKENPKFPVRIIKNEKNLGFSAGHNLGIKESRGELILCLNQDVILAPDFVEKAADFFEKNRSENIGALQPKLLRLDSELQPSDTIDTTGLVMLKNRRIISRGQGEKDVGQFNKEREIFGADGASPVYKREALEDTKIDLSSSARLRSDFPSELRRGAQIFNQIKDLVKFGEYFDEDFFIYKEDVDLAWRMRLYGWKTFYVPQVLAWHGRGAGESAATNYLNIIKERLKINKFAKFFSFKNQRLMQIKNEQLGLLARHLSWFLPKEIASWIYIILFEHYTWKAIKELFKTAPKAFIKRKIIMKNKKVSAKAMKRWFA